jgi:phosphate transport system ATP-binding protein
MNEEQLKLSAKSVDLWFGSKHVLKNVNVAFPRNQITALIGPSGCGKSTLLRCFNRMHELSAEARIKGHFLLDKEELYAKNSSVTQVRRRIGMVFQQANPFPKSIYENINYGLKINDVPQGRPRRDHRERT